MALSALSACSDATEDPSLAPVVIGKLENPAVSEASGLARSYRRGNLLWIINDSGADESVHAISPRGRHLGEFELQDAENKDWEDLASFVLDGNPYLMVADIGDNEAVHGFRTLYVVAEPFAETEVRAQIDWQIDFRYPDGPRDAEAVAVDVDNGRALVLSKRDIPPVLYELPLRPEGDGIVTAKRLGKITSLPRPSRQDIEFAPKLDNWYWQPVGMDISDDNLAAAVLTYRAVFYYERRPGQDWFDALNTPPRRVGIDNLRNAEAIAFGDRRRTVVITGESRHSPVLGIDFNEDSTQ